MHQLELLYPEIAWREPVPVRLLDEVREPVTRYACRLCIALYGLSGTEVPFLPTDIEVVRLRSPAGG